MSDQVTVRTGGVVVGRKNSTFNLDTARLVLDLARRKYRVYLRGSDRGSHPNHVVMVRLDQDGRLELYRTIHEQPATDKLLASYGRPNWWADLDKYLTLLAPDLMNTSITTEEPCPTL